MNEQEHEANDDVVIESDSSAGNGDEMDIAEEETRVDSKLAKIKKELEQCRSEKQEYLDGWQRAKADYVNAQRRFDEDKAALKAAATAKTVETLLPALDSLERARAAGDLPEGFAGIAKQLDSAFMALGVAEIPAAVGQAFDPAQHEALGQDPTDDASKDDTISAVLEKGWQAGEVIIRPAKVRVAHHG